MKTQRTCYSELNVIIKLTIQTKLSENYLSNIGFRRIHASHIKYSSMRSRHILYLNNNNDPYKLVLHICIYSGARRRSQNVEQLKYMRCQPVSNIDTYAGNPRTTAWVVVPKVTLFVVLHQTGSERLKAGVACDKLWSSWGGTLQGFYIVIAHVFFMNKFLPWLLANPLEAFTHIIVSAAKFQLSKL